MSYFAERYAVDDEFRERKRRIQRESYYRNRDRYIRASREWYRRMKNGELQLSELDWAICERGGSEAQAVAHRRRGEKPCAACRKAEAYARRERYRRKVS